MRRMACHTVPSEASRVLFTGDLTWRDDDPPQLEFGAEQRCDLTVIPNLEGPLLPSGPRQHHRRGVTCGLWNGEGVRQLLTTGCFEVVGVANNHMCDFPAEASHALDELNRCGIRPGGAGASMWEASHPVRLVLKDGTSVMILFVGDWRTGCTKPTGGRVGICTPSEAYSCSVISGLRRDYPTDIIVASVHAGEELQSSPAPHARRWLRALADAGADVVFGHHPHVPYAAERVGDSWIFHSLGNFLMGQGSYDGIDLDYPAASLRGLGIVMGAEGLATMHTVADPVAGIVRQEGPLVSPEAETSPRFAGLMALDDTEYAAMFRRARTTSWWYPLWTGCESPVASAAKAAWLKGLQEARGVLVQRPRGVLDSQ